MTPDQGPLSDDVNAFLRVAQNSKDLKVVFDNHLDAGFTEDQSAKIIGITIATIAIAQAHNEQKSELEEARKALAVLVKRNGGRVVLAEKELEATEPDFLWSHHKPFMNGLVLRYREGDDGTL